MYPLHLAARNGVLLHILMLVRAYRSLLRERDFRDRLPLHMACEKPFAEVVALLVNEGSPVNPQDADGVTPLYQACCYRPAPFYDPNQAEEVVRFLLAKGADPAIATRSTGSTPLIQVAGSHPGVGILRSLLGDFRSRSVIDAVDAWGETALCKATVYNRPAAVKLLLQAGADPMVTNSQGFTTLYMAQLLNHDACALLLKVSPPLMFWSECDDACRR